MRQPKEKFGFQSKLSQRPILIFFGISNISRSQRVSHFQALPSFSQNPDRRERQPGGPASPEGGPRSVPVLGQEPGGYEGHQAHQAQSSR